MDTGTWYPSREQWNRGGSQRPEPDAMVEAALAAATPAEAQESIAEADEYAMSRQSARPTASVLRAVRRGATIAASVAPSPVDTVCML